MTPKVEKRWRKSFYYRQLPGNIPDSKTVKSLLEDIRHLGFKKVHMVMDRGFYSGENINGLYREHIKFLIGTKASCRYVKEKLDQNREAVRSWENYSECHDTFGMRCGMTWDYTAERPYKKDTVHEKRRAYLFLYYNGQKATDDEKAFSKKLMEFREELETGKRKPSNEKLYEKYFALLGNEPLNAEEALAVYRNKDEVEKAFYDIKDRLDCRRTNVSSELSLNEKIFVEFVALIFISYIKKKMKLLVAGRNLRPGIQGQSESKHLTVQTQEEFGSAYLIIQKKKIQSLLTF